MKNFKKEMPQDMIIVENKSSRSFSYKIKDVGLSFSLIIDDDSQPKSFIKLLSQAQADIQKMIDTELSK